MMARIDRKYQSIFSLTSSENGQFGSGQIGTKVLTDDLDTIQALSAWVGGWSYSVLGANKFPPLEEMNSLGYVTTYQLAYLFQEGIPEYNATTTYFAKSIVKKAGTYEVYGSKTDNNTGNALTDNSNWELLQDLSGTTTGFTTGDAKITFKTTPDTGWIMADDGSIGSADSGATNRANADTEDLYTLLWNNVSDTYAPVNGGRGVSAAADFADDKKLTLPKMLDHALGVAGAGSGLTSRAIGENVGAETHTLTGAESGTSAHSHLNGMANENTDPFVYGGTTTGMPGSATKTHTEGTDTITYQGNTSTTSAASASSAHNNMQPTSFVNLMIKL